MKLPLTASDLRAIADAVDPLEDLPAITQSPLIGRVEVYRPDGDDGDVIGHLVREGEGDDAWYGFMATPDGGATQ